MSLFPVAAILPRRRLFDECRPPSEIIRANASDTRRYRPIGGHAIDSSADLFSSTSPFATILPAAEVERLQGRADPTRGGGKNYSERRRPATLASSSKIGQVAQQHSERDAGREHLSR